MRDRFDGNWDSSGHGDKPWRRPPLYVPARDQAQVLVEILNAKELHQDQSTVATVERGWRALPAERLLEFVYRLGGSIESGERLEFLPNDIVLCREGGGRLWAVSHWGHLPQT